MCFALTGHATVMLVKYNCKIEFCTVYLEGKQLGPECSHTTTEPISSVRFAALTGLSTKTLCLLQLLPGTGLEIMGSVLQQFIMEETTSSCISSV